MFTIGLREHSSHTDNGGTQLKVGHRVVLDGAGVVGVAIELGFPREQTDARIVTAETLADMYIRPALEAAVSMLTAGEFLGRSRCSVDLTFLGLALGIDHQRHGGAAWVPTAVDLPVPPASEDISKTALLAANAYARSAGVRAFDERPKS
jgi:hypothetical protein